MKKLILIKNALAIFWIFFLTVPATAQVSTKYFNEAYGNDAWYQKALVNQGNSSRIADVMRKAEKGIPVTIGVIGGSITAGAAASDPKNTAYAPLIVAWWKNKFPKSEFKFINAGIGATNSIFGVHRVDADLIKYNPDLVLVEYSVNDRDEADAMEAYEGLMRKILKSGLQTAVVAIATMGDKGDNWQDQHLPVCRHYDIPMLSYRDAIWPEVVGGKIVWSDISPDNVHPNDRGHAYIAGLACRYFNEVYRLIYKIPLADNRLQQALTFNGYEHSKLLDPVTLPDHTDWLLENNALKGTHKGKPLVITVKAGYINIMFTKTNLSIGAKAYVVIDGKERIDMDADFSGGWGNYQKSISLLHDKGKGKHTLAFYYDDERAGKEFVIDKILLANY